MMAVSKHRDNVLVIYQDKEYLDQTYAALNETAVFFIQSG
jgi:hypothetical protein